MNYCEIVPAKENNAAQDVCLPKMLDEMTSVQLESREMLGHIADILYGINDKPPQVENECRCMADVVQKNMVLARQCNTALREILRRLEG